ncbi:hypothetical protein GPJ56_007240 [Histomonas meleagridis]|nr:hypothetical protein GPJ56_007240 [Histomonas meleagridis]
MYYHLPLRCHHGATTWVPPAHLGMPRPWCMHAHWVSPHWCSHLVSHHWAVTLPGHSRWVPPLPGAARLGATHWSAASLGAAHLRRHHLVPPALGATTPPPPGAATATPGAHTGSSPGLHSPPGSATTLVPHLTWAPHTGCHHLSATALGATALGLHTACSLHLSATPGATHCSAYLPASGSLPLGLTLHLVPPPACSTRPGCSPGSPPGSHHCLVSLSALVLPPPGSHCTRSHTWCHHLGLTTPGSPPPECHHHLVSTTPGVSTTWVPRTPGPPTATWVLTTWVSLPLAWVATCRCHTPGCHCTGCHTPECHCLGATPLSPAPHLRPTPLSAHHLSLHTPGSHACVHTA